MKTVTFADLSKRSAFNGFYVPRFEIRIADSNLPEAVLRDVVSLTYKDNNKEIDSFELTVGNWDAETRAFKYIGSETRGDLDGGGDAAARFKLFEPCDKRVEVRVGYGDALETLMTGEVTSMEPNFPGAGPPTLTVQGLNGLHRLRAKQRTYAWVGKKPSQIVKELSNLKDKGEPRLPIPVDVVPNASEQPVPYIAQDNQYEIDFILNLARRYGYEAFIRQVGKEERLYFGPSQRATPDETLKLSWGEAIIDFKPVITTANQLKKVTVRGWDRRKKAPIVHEIDVTSDKFAKNNPDLKRLITSCNPREEKVVNLGVFTKADAKEKAEALLLRSQQGFVKATVKTIGNPRIRAGAKVLIAGLGARLSGEWFIEESTHRIGTSAYTTEFKAHREGPSKETGG